MTVISMHSMSLNDAQVILNQIGYDEAWSTAELYAALNEPHGLEMVDIQTALKVVGGAAAAALAGGSKVQAPE